MIPRWVWGACLLLVVAMSGCEEDPFEPGVFAFMVSLLNETHKVDFGPPTEVELWATYPFRTAAGPNDVRTVQMGGALAPSQSFLGDVSELAGSRAVRFSARLPGTTTVLAETTCQYREDRGNNAGQFRLVTFGGDGGVPTDYTMICWFW